MEEEKILKVLERIYYLINDDSLDLAKEYVQLEIDNLKGITEHNCKNTKYYFYDSFCKYCSNENCSKKREII